MRDSSVQDWFWGRRSSDYAQVAHYTPLLSLRLLGFFIFVLLVAPRSRVPGLSIPLYFVDALLAALLISALGRPRVSSRPLSLIPRLAGIYTLFVCIGEVRGMIDYGEIAESIYMLGRFCMAISLVFVLPRLVTKFDDLKPVIKGIVFGLLVTSLIVILYSLGATRPLLANTIFSWDFLNPGAARYLQILEHSVGEGATRGTSLIGAATMTTGFLGTMWPMAFLASQWPELGRRWQKIARLTSVIVPLGLLATYGRAAWLIVIAVVIMAGIFGFGGGRRKAFALVSVCLVIVYFYGEESDLFMMNRLKVRTEATINAPLENPEERERFASYFEPFEHLYENPSWLIAGAGRTGEKLVNRGELETQLFDEATLATHSAFAMAYYAFGLPGAICQILLMIAAARLILRRLKSCGKDRQQRLYWQALFMSWTGLLFWWLSGHAAVGEPRGEMLLFFWFGLLLVLSRLSFAGVAER